MALYRSLRPALPFASALLLACGIEHPLGTGTDSTGSDTGTSTTDAETGTTAEEPTTGEPASGCGDGVVEWHHAEGGEFSSARALGVAVDGSGRIVVLAEESFEPMVFVLDPAGAEVWRKKLSGEPSAVYDIVVDEAGRIFVGGEDWVMGSTTAMVRAFSPDGEELWSFSEPGAAPTYVATIGGLGLGQGALFSAGTSGTDAVVVRRHDPATGEAVWKTSHSESIQQVSSAEISVAGDKVLVVARAALAPQATAHPFVLQLDGDGAVESFTVEDEIAGFWLDVEPIGGAGEWILAGEHLGGDDFVESVAVKRAGPDGEAWSTLFTSSEMLERVWDVKVAPDERVLVVGATSTDDLERQIPSVRCMAGDGSDLRQETFELSDAEYQNEAAHGGAFGPGFFVVVGDKQVGTHDELWVRKYAIE